MITEKDVDTYTNILGSTALSKVVARLNDKGFRNKWGNPWTRQSLLPYWKGELENIDLENQIVAYALEEKNKAEELEEAKKQLSA